MSKIRFRHKCSKCEDVKWIEIEQYRRFPWDEKLLDFVKLAIDSDKPNAYKLEYLAKLFNPMALDFDIKEGELGIIE